MASDTDEELETPPPAISPIAEPARRASAPPPPSSRLVGTSDPDAARAEQRPARDRSAADSPSMSSDLGRRATSESEEFPDGQAAEDTRRPRRRRSTSDTPPIPTPMEFADDAVGRVLLIAGTTPEITDRAEPSSIAVDVASSPTGVVALLTEGWVAVGGLGALLLVVFVLGWLASR